MKKKLIVIALAILILCMSFMGCSSKTYDVKKSDQQIDLSLQAYNTLEYISKNYQDRTIGSEASQDFVSEMKNSLQAYGYAVTEQSYTANSSKATSNIIAIKTKEGTNDKIVIGASWDNVYGDYETHPDGAYQSGASIAALLTLADYFNDKELSYNLEFVLFSGGSDNWSGAQYFVDKLTAQDKQNIKLFINLGYVAGGDNQYIYARDLSTNYEDFINQVLKANDITAFSKVPLYKNTFAATISENQTYRYSHIGMFGNNIIFMNNKIPSINYLSINWSDYSTPVYVEKKGYNNICEGSYDTLDVMIERNGVETIKSQLNAVVVSTIDTIYVNQTELLGVLQSPDEVNSFFQSDMAYYIFNVAVKIILVALIILSVVYAKNIISKRREEYQKIKKDTPVLKVTIPTDGKGLEELDEMLKKFIDEEENKKKNKDNDNKDDDNNTTISDDDVFQ